MLIAGLTAFHTHHQAAYKARWMKSLYPALLIQHPSVAVLNQHLPPRQLAQVRQQLMQLGAKRWERGNKGEVEAWKFDDDTTLPTGEQQPMEQLTNQMSSLSTDQGDLDADERPFTTRFNPPNPVDPNSPLLPYYLLDAASVLAVDALTVGSHHSVLDLCAAPGGKSIVAAQALDLLDQRLPPAATPAESSDTLAFTQPLATLHSNEPQANRRLRLQNVLSEYIPQSVRKNRTRVEVTGWDATKISLPVCRYDRVLVDAPCSSDRHVLSNSKELASWTTKRIHSNAERQELLLLNALKSVKIGGICVYATCSLSRRENDQVIANVLEKLEKNKRNGSAGHRIHVQVLKIRLTGTEEATADELTRESEETGISYSIEDVLYLPMGEPTKFGWMVLPDQVMNKTQKDDDNKSSTESSSSSSSTPIAHGFGPLYFARLKRVAGSDAEEESDEDYSDSDEEESEEEEAKE